MRREGWIYALAFLVIVGVGALIIVPRLDRGRVPLPAAGSDPLGLPVGPEPAQRAGPAVASFEGRPAYDWVTISVTGTDGALRGPLRDVHGADVEALREPDAGVHTLRVRPRGPVVYFGAAGHQWVARASAGLAQAPQVALPDAAQAIVVRVREPDGRPAADVPVRVQPAAPGEAPRTDAGGTLVLDHLPPGLVLLDLASALRSGPRLRLRAGEDRDVRVVLDPAWTVRGRVVDRQGEPCSGARVTALGPAGVLGPVVETAADGRFSWHGPAVARLAVRVRAAGWGEHSIEAEPPPLGALVTDLGVVRLQTAGVTVDGRVGGAVREVDAQVEVEPAVAALVREVFGAGPVLDRPRRVPLDADGRFRLHDLPPNLPLRISLRGAGVPVDVIVQGKPGEEIPVELTPTPGETLVGTLHHPDGEPASGLRLLLSHEARDGDVTLPGDVVVVTGADGSFRRRGLVGRTWFLRSYAAGRRSLLRRVVLPLSEPLVLTFEPAVTDAARRIEGRVFDGVRTAVKTEAGDPWVGQAAEIRYGRPLAGVSVRAAGVRAVTDAEGRFRLEGVESLAPTVGLSWGFDAGPQGGDAPDPRPFVTVDRLDVTPGGKALDLILERAATLRFCARDAITDAPLTFVHVVLRTDQGRLIFDRGVAPRDGWVEIPGLPPRGVELTVLARGRRFHRAPVLLRAGALQDLGDVLLLHGMRIEGHVVDPTGKPIPDARIGAYGKGWHSMGQDPGADRELLLRTARSDAQGRFTLQGFDPRKPADLAVWAEGWAPTSVRVELPKFSDVVLAQPEIKLAAPTWLALDLHQAARESVGGRVRGAMIDLQFAYGGSSYLDLLHRGMLGGVLASTRGWQDASKHLLFEERGSPGYLVGPLRAGPYDLWVERLGYEPLRRKITVIDPEQAWLVDVVTGREERMIGRVTRLRFEMTPAR